MSNLLNIQQSSGDRDREIESKVSPYLSKTKLHEAIREVDPSVQLDDDVEEVLISLADSFVERAIEGSCRIAKHRNSKTCESRDVRLYTEQQYKIWVPGFGTDELKPYRRSANTDSHRQRLMLIKRAMKK